MPESGPAAISTIARTGYARTSLCLSVLAAFAEGFGAYSLALYPTADIPLQATLVARKESLQHPGSRELAATVHAHEADLLSENIRPGSGSTLDARAMVPEFTSNDLQCGRCVLGSLAPGTGDQEGRRGVGAIR